ncbi:MAG: M23 family metallopeptidase [Thermodesulfobacteriota bacterium]|nr:M23 family metallopeptidase [Thermodesulfobacteriota bacterium]
MDQKQNSPVNIANASIPETYSVDQVQASLPFDNLGNYTEIQGKINIGDSLSSSLTRHHVPGHVRAEIIRSLSSCLNLKRIQPDDRFSVILDESESLVKCSYECGPLERYTVEKKNDIFTAGRDAIDLDVQTVVFQSSIESSLLNAFLDQGEKSPLVYEFIDIFSSKIDFNTEPCKGDRIEAVFEKYYKEGSFIGYGRILYARYQQNDGDHEAFYYASGKTPGLYFDSQGRETGTSFIKSPVPVGRLTSKFTWHRKHPILGVVRPHLGIDLAAPVGTPIMAAADGRVQFKGTRGGFGKQIILSHSGGYKTYYGHLRRFKKGLKRGSQVSQKDIIGYVGSTGLSTGPHLDYRISVNGVFKNPLAMDFKPKSVLKDSELKAFQKDIEKLIDKIHQVDGHNVMQVRHRVLQPDESIAFL